MNDKKTGITDRSVIDILSLHDISRQLNAAPSMDSIIDLLERELCGNRKYKAVLFYIYNEQNGKLDLWQSDPNIQTASTPDETMLWLMEHQTIQVDQICNATRKKQTASVINILLQVQKRNLGFVQFIVPVSPELITPEDQQMLSLLGCTIASCIHNFNLNAVIERNNQTLNQVEIYLNGVFESMIHGIMVVEHDGTISLLSKTMDLIFNLQHKDAVGRQFRDLFPEEIVNIFNGMIDELSGDEVVMDREFEVALHDNTLVKISITASNIEIDKNHSGTIFLVKTLSSCKDLIALAEVDKLKSNFVATVSHEFKTPLNLILGSTNLLQEGLVGSLNEKQLKLVKLIRDGGNRLMVLTKSLLDLAKLEAGKGQLQLEPVSLKKLIDTTVSRFSHILQDHRISLTTRFNDEIDQIMADNEKLAQMMHHVISNAIKYNNPGGAVEITVNRWEKDQSEKFVTITVADSGIGITEQEQETIFDEFHRVDDPEVLEREGIGLGLTIAKKVIDLHRGKVLINSHANEGTEITIILPRDPRIL